MPPGIVEATVRRRSPQTPWREGEKPGHVIIQRSSAHCSFLSSKIQPVRDDQQDQQKNFPAEPSPTGRIMSNMEMFCLFQAKFWDGLHQWITKVIAYMKGN